MKLVISYFLTTVVFFLIDMTWLGFVAKNFYREHLGSFLSDQVNWIAAVVFYLIYIVGIFIFAILPGVQEQSARHAFCLGAALGLLCYATYDLTNLATLNDWPIKVVVVDMAWGAILTGVVAFAGFHIHQKVHLWLGGV